MKPETSCAAPPDLSDGIRLLGILGILSPDDLVCLLQKLVLTPIHVTAAAALNKSPSGLASMERISKACDAVCARLCKGHSSVDPQRSFCSKSCPPEPQDSTATLVVAHGYAAWHIQVAAFAVGVTESAPPAPVFTDESQSAWFSDAKESLPRIERELLMTLCLHRDLQLSMGAASHLSKLWRLFKNSLDCMHASHDAASGFLSLLCSADGIPTWLDLLHWLRDEGPMPTISRPWLWSKLQCGLHDLLQEVTPYLEEAMASSVADLKREEWGAFESDILSALERQVRCGLPDDRHADWQPAGDDLQRLMAASLLCDADGCVSVLRRSLAT